MPQLQAHVRGALNMGVTDEQLAAIPEALKATKEALVSGCKYFIGGHGGMVEKPAVEARIAYLEKMKALRAEKSDAVSFTMALKDAFPDMPGDIASLAEALYK